MAGLEIPTWDPSAAMLIGIVLFEAIVLYTGYGVLERIVGPRLLRVLIGGDDAV